MSTKEKGSNEPTTQSIEEPERQSEDDVAADGQQAGTELSLDLIFEVLKNRRRREVIRYLREHEQQVTLSDLAEHIAALENNTDVASITSSQRKRVYVGLYQCHLPKMADMDIVHFNQNRGLIDLGPNAPQLYEYLDNDAASGQPWHRYYMGISGVGIVIFVLAVAFSGQIAVFQTAALGGLCVAIAACSVFQTLSERDSDE